ncbi:Sec-independent protein translocase protein TatB [Ferrovibrio sp.]|uniref:Sec-independent protein translocase protein TatB n=1 Tax=Ferrovibrio sp. TaxID=1917215 RepID=UPI00311E43DF
MFDIAWSELGLVAVVALVVIGPKDLPKVLRTVGQWTSKARSMAREFQSGLDDMVREAELEDLRKAAKDVSSFSLENEIKKTVDPDGAIGGDFKQVEAEMNAMLNEPDSQPAPAASVPAPEPAAAPADETGKDGKTP